MTDTTTNLLFNVTPYARAGKVLYYLFVKLRLGKVVLACAGLGLLLLTRRIRQYLRSPLGRVVCSLLRSESYSMFYPRVITKSGSHYATTRDGIDGFVRVTGFHNDFFPVINLFNSKLSLFKFLGYYLNCTIQVKRQDVDYVQLDASSFELSTDHYPMTMSFVKDGTAALGYMTDKEARVQLQAAPYVGCDLSLEEFEVMRLRVGKGQVNFGYLEFMAKTCSYEVDRLDIPKVGQALREECRVLCFEPAWVVPVVEGGDGDITVTLLGQENDVDLSKVKHIGKLIPSPCDQESVVYVANKSAETACWKDRIEAYVKKNEQVVPGVYFAYRNEFVQRLVPSIYRGTGALDDEVTALGRQVRASQKLGYDQIKFIS